MNLNALLLLIYQEANAHARDQTPEAVQPTDDIRRSKPG